MGNFTDRNKHTDHNKSEAGFRMFSAPKENGFGRVGLDSVMSQGSPEYPSAPNKPIINGDGMDNFRGEDKFTGQSSDLPDKGVSAGGSKDSIETMGNNAERKAY